MGQAVHAPGKSTDLQGVDSNLARHLRALSLESTASYQAWCRENGFPPALNKTWHDRRLELQHAAMNVSSRTPSEDLTRHIRALGLAGTEEYEAWLRDHGLGTRGGPARRQQELELAVQERAQKALAGSAKRRKRPEELIERLYRRETIPGDLKSPHAVLMKACFERTTGSERDSFRRLLRVAARARSMLSPQPAIAPRGPQPGNSFIEALLAMAQSCDCWLAPPEDWSPGSHGAMRQLRSLSRHLFARYDVPPFMDSAWFEGDCDQSHRRQRWFIHIGSGLNIRTADIPVIFSKRAAHYFLQAPHDYHIDAALRWGQVRALGGDEHLCRAIVSTRLGETLENEEFWFSVLHFFVNNPMLDYSCIGPIVDYLYYRKFVPVEINDGEPPRPLEPDLSMKGRTAPALLRRVEEWHRELARENRRPPLRWEPSGLESLSKLVEDSGGGAGVRWTVLELISRLDLVEEGRDMRHCVASYAASCARGQKSIWSIGVEDCRTGSRRRVMTVEVDNLKRAVIQARGRCNRVPGQKRSSARLLDAAPILKEWAVREGLRMAVHF